MNRKLDVAICADARLTLRAFTAAWPGGANLSEWMGHLRALRAQREADLAHAQRTALRRASRRILRELKLALPSDVLYAWDGGDFAHWGRVSLPALNPGGWLGSDRWVPSGRRCRMESRSS